MSEFRKRLLGIFTEAKTSINTSHEILAVSLFKDPEVIIYEPNQANRFEVVLEYFNGEDEDGWEYPREKKSLGFLTADEVIEYIKTHDIKFSNTNAVINKLKMYI